MQVGQEMIEIHEFKPGRRSRAIIESWKIVKTLGERKDWWCWQVWQAHVWFACLVCIKHSCLGLSGWEPRTEYVAIFSFVSFSFWFVWFVLMNLAASQIVTIVWWFVCWDFPWFLWDSIMFHNPQGYPSKQVRQKSLQTCQSPNLPREEFLQKNFFALRAPPGDMRAWGANNKGPSGGPAQVRTTGLLFFFFPEFLGGFDDVLVFADGAGNAIQAENCYPILFPNSSTFFSALCCQRRVLVLESQSLEWMFHGRFLEWFRPDVWTVLFVESLHHVIEVHWEVYRYYDDILGIHEWAGVLEAWGSRPRFKCCLLLFWVTSE